MFDIASVILSVLVIISFAVGFIGGLIHIAKRMKRAAVISRFAKAGIGGEVSIYRDKGANFAYKGIYDYMNGDFSKALTRFEKAMAFSGGGHNKSFCFDWMSRCYDALEKTTESLDCRVKAVEAEPSNLKSLFNLADMYVRMGSFSKAEFYYNRILRYDSDNIAATFMLGTLFMGRGLYDKAEEQFVKTLQLDNKSDAAAAELSVIMAIKGDYSKMESYFEKTKNGNYTDPDRLKKRLNSIKKVKELCNDY